MKPRVIEIKSLYKKYPRDKQFALDDFSLEIKKGEFYGLLGPNGCGKTTLISIICGLYQSSKGELKIFGKKHTEASIKHKIGLVPQDIALYEDLTLQDNLNLFGHMYKVKSADLKENIDYLLKAVDLKEHINKKVKHFSGGMKRRANIAVALVHSPKILILDEPTVGVDPISRNTIFECLSKLNNEGLTILYTTHYLEEAEKLCSRIGIMNLGKIRVEGKLKDITQKGEISLSTLFLDISKGKYT